MGLGTCGTAVERPIAPIVPKEMDMALTQWQPSPPSHLGLLPRSSNESAAPWALPPLCKCFPIPFQSSALDSWTPQPQLSAKPLVPGISTLPVSCLLPLPAQTSRLGRDEHCPTAIYIWSEEEEEDKELFNPRTALGLAYHPRLGQAAAPSN